MLRLPDLALDNDTAAALAGYQEEVNAAGDYAAQVAHAKKLFKRYNTNRNTVFNRVKQHLGDMCHGARRCGYCEDSAADEVEHIRPKDLYPDRCFDWGNYLYACGPCNGPKNNRFAVIDPQTGHRIDVSRKRDDEVVAPPSGDPALIDPRREDPLHFLDLDILGTFVFLPAEGLQPRDYERADYTLRVLRLNERDMLVESRRNAYVSFRARLREYVEEKRLGASEARLESLAADLTECPHPTVWAEMKRQQGLIPELKWLFDEAPEALNW